MLIQIRPGYASSGCLRYASAILMVLLTLAVRVTILPGPSGPGCLSFFPCVLLCYLFCGLGPGAAASVLGAAIAYLAFFAPIWTAAFKPNAVSSVAVFLVSAGLIHHFTREFERSKLNCRTASATVRETQAHYESLYTATPAMLHSIDPDGRLLTVSDLWLSKLGYRREEVIGRRSIEFLTPESAAFAVRQVLPEFYAKGAITDVEYQMVRKDGTIVDVCLSGILERAADGRPLKSLAHIVDVTEQRRLMAALRRSHERVRELAQRLESIREDERRAIALVLHEGIAQDLCAVKLGLDQLRGQTAGRPAFARRIDDISHAIAKCMGETRRIADDLRPSALAHLCLASALEAHARHFAEVSGLDVRVTKTAPLGELDEEVRLVFFRAAQEALTNVARHARASRIEIVLRADAESVRMDVIDNGRGIDEKSLNKVGSLGLLGICERFAARGGTAAVRRNPDSGTTLSVAMPASVTAVPAAPERLALRAVPG